MQLEYFNCPQPEELKPNVLPAPAEFLTYIPDWATIDRVVQKYHMVRNVLVIGNGGSRTSFVALTQAMKEKLTKQVYVLNTVDPDYIYELKRKLNPNNTLVITVSKSGENTTQMESTLHFVDYPLLIITEKNSPLHIMGEKLKAEIVEHPPIGGRYTGFTEVTLLPAAICGLDAQAYFQAGRQLHDRYQNDNTSWQAASVFWQLEQQRYLDVFVPIYSHNLAESGHLIMQLCHESFGKDGKGQTYVAVEGPEWQHHSSQRFYGGPKNVAGLFITVDNFAHSEPTRVSPELHSVPYKNKTLADLDDIPLDKALTFEWQGNLEDIKLHDIPLMRLSLSQLSETELGTYVAFWQLYALYASILRKVNPFDQPKVEASKKISFDKRLQFKGLL